MIAATSAHVESHPGATRFGLDWLIAPTAYDEFFSMYWEQEPLVIHREDPSYYDGLLSLADVDHVLATSAIRETDIRVIRAGKHTPLSRLGTSVLPGSSNLLEGLYREYRAGATIVIQALHERWGSLGRLCRNMARAVSGATQVNVYLTPPSETGLLPHYDTHDVMVLQVSGSKSWKLFGRPVDAPIREQPYDRSIDTGEITREFVMRAGDFMYLPRGTIHVAEARKEPSLHLTVGIHPVTLASIIRAAVEGAISKDSRLRKALTPGFAHDRLSRERSIQQLREAVSVLLQSVDPKRAIDEAAKWAILSEPPLLEGHLLDLAAAADVTLGTELQIRSDLDCSMEKADDQISITFNGKHVRMPAYVMPCLEYMRSRPTFIAGDLPSVIDDVSKLTLVVRLLREGFLTTDCNDFRNTHCLRGDQKT